MKLFYFALLHIAMAYLGVIGSTSKRVQVQSPSFHPLSLIPSFWRKKREIVDAINALTEEALEVDNREPKVECGGRTFAATQADCHGIKKRQIIDAINELVSDSINKATGLVTDGLNKANGLVTDGVNKANELVLDGAQEVDKASDLVSDALDKANELVSDGVNKANNLVSDSINEVNGLFEDGLSEVKELFSGGLSNEGLMEMEDKVNKVVDEDTVIIKSEAEADPYRKKKREIRDAIDALTSEMLAVEENESQSLGLSRRGAKRAGCPAISCSEAHLYSSPTFGDPRNCGSYLQCPDGVPVSQSCGPGSCFSTVVCNCLPCASALVRCN